MGRIYYDIAQYSADLDIAIAESMIDPNGSVQKGAKKAIKESVENNVYNAYTPKFISRRGDSMMLGGGIMSEDNIMAYATGNGFTVTMQDLATWQHLYGGAYPDNELAEVVENDGLYGAPPRPFMQKAEESYEDNFGNDLVKDMELKGF